MSKCFKGRVERPVVTENRQRCEVKFGPQRPTDGVQVDINDLAKNLGEEGLQGHPMTMAVVMAFLSGFRQFDIAV